MSQEQESVSLQSLLLRNDLLEQENAVLRERLDWVNEEMRKLGDHLKDTLAMLREAAEEREND